VELSAMLAAERERERECRRIAKEKVKTEEVALHLGRFQVVKAMSANTKRRLGDAGVYVYYGVTFDLQTSYKLSLA
jgi:hypothetical protein